MSFQISNQKEDNTGGMEPCLLLYTQSQLEAEEESWEASRLPGNFSIHLPSGIHYLRQISSWLLSSPFCAFGL